MIYIYEAFEVFFFPLYSIIISLQKMPKSKENLIIPFPLQTRQLRRLWKIFLTRFMCEGFFFFLAVSESPGGVYVSSRVWKFVGS